jgi:hypothetical protein
MLVTIIAPEYVLGKALADLCAAHISKWRMRAYVKSDGVEWGLMHAFFANMGGFVLTQNPNQLPDNEWPGLDGQAFRASQQNLKQAAVKQTTEIVLSKSSQSGLIKAGPHEPVNVNKLEDAVAETLLMRLPGNSSGGISTKPDNKILPYVPETETIRIHHCIEAPQTPEISHPFLRSDLNETLAPAARSYYTPYNVPFHLLASEIFALRHTGAFPRLPKITPAEIADKSKGDTFVKLIISFQVLWFILQVIVRAVRHLSISQLEIAVTAFGICAIITYLLLLPKPKGVDIPITLMEFEGRIPIDLDRFKTLRERVLQRYVRALFVPGDDIVNEVDLMGSHIPDDALDAGLEELIVLHVGISIGGVTFGATHVAAWNFLFPTLIEQTLWRTASIMATALLPAMYFPLLLEQFFLHGYFPLKLIKYWNISFGSLYVVARAFLLVEIFRTLFYLPEDAYVTTWATNIPNVS